MLARPALTVKPTSIMTTMVLLFVSASSTIVLATAVSATSDVEGGINSSSSNPGSSSPSSSLTSSEGAAEVGGGSAMTMGGLERGTSGMFFVVHPRDHILGKSEQSVKVECTAFGANKITIRYSSHFINRIVLTIVRLCSKFKHIFVWHGMTILWSSLTHGNIPLNYQGL